MWCGRQAIGIRAALVLLAVCAAGCVRVAPVRVQVDPIHVTVDVNVKLQKVDKQLEDFFSDVYSGNATTNTPATKEAGQ